MIKNIVFDLGGVLIDFNPENFLRELDFKEDDVIFFNKIIFSSQDWKNYNSSQFSFLETRNNLINKYPSYAEEIRLIFDNFDCGSILSEIKSTSDYLISLKNQGYKIYILSDSSKETYDYFKKYDFFKYIDGAVYSFEVGFIKPNIKNYVTLLNKYKLIPAETIFIDDRLPNIDMAEKIGIHGILFTTLDEVKNEVLNLI